VKILQVSVVSRRHGSAERDKRENKPRPLLLVTRAALPDGELTVLGLLTERERGLRYA